MSLPYTADDLKPASTDTFRAYSWRDDAGPGFDVADLVNQSAVAAVGETFASANLAHEAWQYAEREGRLDSRRAWRYGAVGDMDIFKDRRAPSASDVRLVILVDASGSMTGHDAKIKGEIAGHTAVEDSEGNPVTYVTRREAAAIFAATMVSGMSILPNVKIEVIQHDFGYTDSEGNQTGRGRHTVNLRRAWEEGTPIQFMNQMPRWMPGGGNADGHAIRAVAEYLRNDCLPDEVPMIVVISDGAPADVGKNPDWSQGDVSAKGALREAVKMTRGEGIDVLSVAIAGRDQSSLYGPGSTVTFTGDWVELAQSIASLVGERVATAYQTGGDDPFAF